MKWIDEPSSERFGGRGHQRDERAGSTVRSPPAGVGFNGVLLTLIDSVGGNDTPPALHEVFAPWELLTIPQAGVAVAIAAALVPGGWAARTNVIEVLHAE